VRRMLYFRCSLILQRKSCEVHMLDLCLRLACRRALQLFLLVTKRERALVFIDFMENNWKCLRNIFKWMLINYVKRNLCMG